MRKEIYSPSPVERAVFAVGGKQKVLAEKLGLSAQAITQVKKRGGKLPRSWMENVMAITGLSKEELYPDIFSRQQTDSDA